MPGLLPGLALGPNPAGEAIGQGDYGWAIWGAAFLLSCPVGALAQAQKEANRRKRKGFRLNGRKQKLPKREESILSCTNKKR